MAGVPPIAPAAGASASAHHASVASAAHALIKQASPKEPLPSGRLGLILRSMKTLCSLGLIGYLATHHAALLTAERVLWTIVQFGSHWH